MSDDVSFEKKFDVDDWKHLARNPNNSKPRRNNNGYFMIYFFQHERHSGHFCKNNNALPQSA